MREEVNGSQRDHPTLRRSTRYVMKRADSGQTNQFHYQLSSASMLPQKHASRTASKVRAKTAAHRSSHRYTPANQASSLFERSPDTREQPVVTQLNRDLRSANQKNDATLLNFQTFSNLQKCTSVQALKPNNIQLEHPASTNRNRG